MIISTLAGHRPESNDGLAVPILHGVSLASAPLSKSFDLQVIYCGELQPRPEEAAFYLWVVTRKESTGAHFSLLALMPPK